MKFNAYFVRFVHPQASFSGNIQLVGENIQANFKKIDGDLFVVYFKNQLELKFLQKVNFKNAKSSMHVLLPVISQYNQRKLKKISEILAGIEKQSFGQIILELLKVEKFLEVRQLLYFFAVERWAAIAVLTELEIAAQVKTITFNELFITSWDHFSQNLVALENALRQAYENREKTLKFSQFGKNHQDPANDYLFQVFIAQMQSNFPFEIIAERYYFFPASLGRRRKRAHGGNRKGFESQ